MPSLMLSPDLTSVNWDDVPTVEIQRETMHALVYGADDFDATDLAWFASKPNEGCK